ncbi:hypothetical protein [Leucobacter salsicius]|uniref:hypothetical protein n=1 Tax=Leucobacter salsicius TaxID=664638 RepID=UPI00034C1C5C|nr:hypothetical protein [Leucobacter salsicius]
MNTSQGQLVLNLNDEERTLLLEAVHNQREFVIEDGYMPEYVDKFVSLAAKVNAAIGNPNQ